MDILKLKDFYLKYIAFYISSVAFHLIIISIITFFHFLLDHRLIVVENWIYDFSWQIFMISKVICFLFFYKYFIFFKKENDLISFTRENFSFNKLDVFLIPLISLAFLLFYIDPYVKSNHEFDLLRAIFHISSIVLTMAIDLLIVLILMKEKGRESLHLIEVVLFSLVSYFSFQSVFLFSHKNAYVLILNVILFYFLYLKKDLGLPFLFISLFIVPLYLLMGFDPIWNGDYSLFGSRITSINIHIFSVLLSIGLYMNWENFKRSVT